MKKRFQHVLEVGPKPHELGPKTRGTGTQDTPQILKVLPGAPESLKVGPRDPRSKFKSCILGPHHSLMNSNFFRIICWYNTI